MPAKAKKAQSKKVSKKSVPTKTSSSMPFYADMQNMLVIGAVVILFAVMVMVLSSMNTGIRY